MFKVLSRFFFLILVLQFIPAQISGDEGQKLRQKLGKELEATQKEFKINKTLLPNLADKEWKVHLVAEEEAFSEVIEIQGNSILYVGKSLVADRIIIHGDGIVWVKGLIQCPIIDIRGKGLVVFETNSVGFNEGWIKLNEGTILSKGANKMNVHLRKGGLLKVGGENHGEVMTSTGDLMLDVEGNQMGDINFLSKSGKANLNIKGDLHGSFSAKGSIDLEIGGDIFHDLIGEKDIKLKAGKVLGGQLSALGNLDADVHQLGERVQPISVSAKSAKLNVVKGRFGNVSLVGNGMLNIGGASVGSISSLQGSLDIKIGAQHKGNISAGGSIKLEAHDAKGDLIAGQNLVANIKKALVAHRVATGKDASIVCELFEGNTDIKGRGQFKAVETRRKSFASLISMGTGKISIQGLHQLDTISKGALELTAKSGSGYIKSAGATKISFAGDHTGKIQTTKGPLNLLVGGRQSGHVHASSVAEVKIGVLSSGLTVLGDAKVEIGSLEVTEYEYTILELDSGTLNILSDAIFDIRGLSSDKWLKVTIKGSRNSTVKSNGHLDLTSSGPSKGTIDANGQLKLKALSHEGDVRVVGISKINITKDWFGNLKSLTKTGTSIFQVNTLRDSNLLFESDLNLKAVKVINRVPGEEQIRVGSGTLLVREELESNLYSAGKVTVKAKRIVGDVFVDDASKVDAIVRGRLRTSMN